MAPKLCIDCGRREKALPRHRCLTCQLRKEPMHIQAEAAQRRLEAVPEPLRRKRSEKAVRDDAPEGTAFCAGCQSYRDEADFGKGATQCKPCSSAKNHAAMVERTYGLKRGEYDKLIEIQGGGCAICGQPFRSVRGAVDHDHLTGEVRGILCSSCNMDLLKAARHDVLILASAVRYMETPPAQSERWRPRSAHEAEKDSAVFASRADGRKERAAEAEAVASCTRPHVAPIGSERVPDKKGVWRYFVEDESDPPF